ncbi:hypothetical protein [Actinomadura sp. J1-007]|uniref:hypothetical protein n=1 Tax=Actinomadura sp. J1-007 TaxID=2661913 RepID=UPI0028162E5E|nr:hypothetical protein [Actinomadura sp. J1-007]
MTENQRVRTAADLLEKGALAEVGALLTESHVSLRDDYEVSWAEADVAVEAALAAGALGARMFGGGFGGSVLALAHRDAIAAVSDAVGKAFAERGWTVPGFLETTAGPAARAL